jgi:hypothetical protein
MKDNTFKQDQSADFKTKERAVKFLMTNAFYYIENGIAEIHGIKVCNCGVCDFIIVSDDYGRTFHLRICEVCGENKC